MLITSLSLALALVGPGYVPIGGRSGVQVFQRDGGAIQLATVGEIDATPAEVQAVLEDYASHPRFVNRLAESVVLARAPGEALVYQHLRLPVIKDRDYTLDVTWEPGAARGVRFHIAPDRGPAPRSGKVRMSTLAGGWDLQPIRDGRATRAIYHVQIDFAGSVPRWMVRGGAAKELPGLYDGIRYEVAQRRTQRTTGVTTATR
jgi:hypothetical protein